MNSALIGVWFHLSKFDPIARTAMDGGRQRHALIVGETLMVMRVMRQNHRWKSPPAVFIVWHESMR
jgi:hypothetical protein